MYVESTILDTLYYTFFQFDRWTHWDRFEFAKEGTGKYLPGWLGVLDLSLYSVAACCVLLSFFGQVTGASAELSWVAIIGLPHYISPLFLGRFSPVLRRFYAVPLRCPASWRRDGENGRKMAENGRNLGEKRARNSGG